MTFSFSPSFHRGGTSGERKAFANVYPRFDVDVTLARIKRITVLSRIDTIHIYLLDTYHTIPYRGFHGDVVWYDMV